MKRSLVTFLGAAVAASSAALAAVPELPRTSPGASVEQVVGVTTIRVDYSRPGVKGREIWGKLVPYGEVWRLGANHATNLSFSTPVKVMGLDVPAGKYALFAIPAADQWKVILNSEADQWGAYFRKPEKDVVSFTVAPKKVETPEWMEFRIEPASENLGRVAMRWAGLEVAFEVEVETRKLVWTQLDAALAAPGDDAAVVYQQAARYSLETGDRKAEALAWVDKSLAAKEDFWAYELKADLLVREGRTAEAVPLLDKAIELSKAGGAPEEWREGALAKKASWLAAKK